MNLVVGGLAQGLARGLKAKVACATFYIKRKPCWRSMPPNFWLCRHCAQDKVENIDTPNRD